jgi:Spy/CpxP family protein refolding chaperone
MSKWKISLYLLALFLAGMVTGAILTAQIGRRMMMRVMQPEAMAGHWQHDLETRLNLTPTQSQKIGPIIVDGMKNFGATLHDQMGLSLSNCNARIALELTPEQKIKFAEIEKEQQAFIRSRFNGGPPPKIP